jgi:uncharacterized damage-inducible protein DinB
MNPNYFHQLAGYNAWANRRLYAVAATLSAAELAQQRPAAFFGSLIGTLNHILVGDRIWLRRFEGAGPQPSRLDEIPFLAFADLAAARRAEDERIESYARGLSAESLTAPLCYRSMSGSEHRQPLWQALAHFFNHQTHHRGQAHALLKEAGREPPALDLVLFQREEAKGG